MAGAVSKNLDSEKENILYGENSMGFFIQANVWTDFVLWETEEDANDATTVGKGKEVTEKFYACIQMNTCRALISKLVKKY